MKPSRAVPALVALVALAAGTAGVALRPGAPAASAAHGLTASPAANGAARRAASQGIARRARVAGDFFRYAVDGRTFVTRDGSAPSPAAPPTVRLKGTWVETTAEAGADRSTSIVAFSPDEVAPETLSRDDLARPFVVERSADGRVAAVAFARSVTGDARQALRTLVAEMQLASPADPSARAWTVDEEDTTGQYRASYGAASPTEVVRRKDGYTRVLSDRGLLPPARGEAWEVDSVTRYRLDGLGAPFRIDLRESLHLTTGADTPALGALALLEMQLTERGHGPVPVAPVGPSERLATLTAKPGSEAAHDAQMAHGADFPTLVSRLADLARMAPEEQRRAAARAIPEARAVLRLDPKAAAEAARVVAARAPGPRAAATRAPRRRGAGA